MKFQHLLVVTSVLAPAMYFILSSEYFNQGTSIKLVLISSFTNEENVTFIDKKITKTFKERTTQITFLYNMSNISNHVSDNPIPNHIVTTFKPFIHTTQNPIRLTWPINSNTPCKRNVKKRGRDEGRWYNYSRKSFTLYTYSSHVDDRDSLESGPVLRIIAISTDVVDMQNRPSIYCRLYFPIIHQTIQGNGAQKETRTDLVMDVEVEKKPDRFVGMGWFLNNENVREFIYTCPLPEKNLILEKLISINSNYTNAFEILVANYTVKTNYLAPSGISLLVGEETHGYKYDDVKSCMPVEASPKIENPKKFALCVQVTYGKVDPTSLVIWMELQKILGVDKIGIYDQNIDKAALEVFKFYAEQGLVDLRRSDYIPHGPEQYLLHGSLVINDCMYRRLHTHEYLLVYDLDEVILPVRNQSSGTLKNFYDLLEELHSKYGSGDYVYSFRNRYFFSDHLADPNEPSGFNILKYKMAAPISIFGYATKSLVNMKACIQMHNHFCWGATETYKERHIVDVSTSLATNQHYKKCHLEEECAEMIKNSKLNLVINAYKSDLLENVYKTTAELRSKFKSSGLAGRLKV